MNFDVAGPFEIKRFGQKRIINKYSLVDMCEQLEAHEPGLSTAGGCYVFAKRVGGGVLPWYVGQACKTPLAKEALNSDNRGKYNDILDNNGTPLLFVIPERTQSGKLRKRRTQPAATLDFLEEWLISVAIDRNPELINSRKTAFLRNLHVTGIFNSQQGESTAASQSLSRVLWRMS
ncbi:hypothetical protein [Acidithiobacillus sulfuriphilus]|uniref:hypothetical protein n=1 Tax=Acidithiobacillus sulfuriphilus TaxID=1867749 RepID=UPI003F608B32